MRSRRYVVTAMLLGLGVVVGGVGGGVGVGGALLAAGSPESLTLRQAVERAVRGNVDLRREGITLRTAEANIVTALGEFDVVLAGDGTFTRQLTPPAGMAINFGVTQSVIFNLTLRRKLETGGELALVGQGGRTTIGSAVPYYSERIGLTFTHPLLRGFGREVTEANLRSARISRDQELWNRQARAANVLRDTIVAYWELAYQTSDLEIRRSAVALAEQQLRNTEALIQVGRMGELQAAGVRRAIADNQQEVEVSQAQLAARGLDLLRLMGTPVPRGFLASGLHAADAAQAQPHDVDADSETSRALAASPALKALQMGVTLSELDVRVAMASTLPKLDLVASIGRIGRNTDLAESIDQLGQQEQTVGAAGLTFELPFQNRTARGTAQAARAAGDGARLSAEDLELSIRDGAARLAAAIRSASRRIDLSRAAVKYAEQNLEAERARFQVGQSTNNDVLLRQQELKQTQISGVRAAVDLLAADVALSALTGDILETYGVTLRGL